MNGYQDIIELDGDFPFRIIVVPLSARYNPVEPFHWHNYFEITLVLEGSGCYYVNGSSFPVEPGDLVIFNNAELHGWQVFRDEMKVLVLVFNANLILRSGDLSDAEYLRPFVERGSNFKNRIGRSEPCAAQITALMAEIRSEWQDRADGFRLMIKADLLRLLTLLVRHYHEDARSPAAAMERNRALLRLQRAFEYIDGAYCGRVTLKDAADRVFMSPAYFSHYFHAATGIRFSEYVAMRRIRRARELLETTGKSIYEIATECGFPNSSNFYRLYRKHTGESPRRRR